MDTNVRIKELCRLHKITVQKLELELGEKPSTIARTTSNSKANKLFKIAKYFNVSMEYLLTGEEPAAGMPLSYEEMDIIKAYRKLSDAEKNIVAKSLDVKRQDTGLQSEKVG